MKNKVAITIPFPSSLKYYIKTKINPIPKDDTRIKLHQFNCKNHQVK